MLIFDNSGNPGSVFRREEQVDLLHDEDVLKIAEKHGKSAGQVLIRYQIDKGRKMCFANPYQPELSKLFHYQLQRLARPLSIFPRYS